MEQNYYYIHVEKAVIPTKRISALFFQVAEVDGKRFSLKRKVKYT